MRIEAIATLLGTEDLPGTREERTILAQRIAELVHRNGEAWVRDHRRELVREWIFIVERGLIRPS
jgi:hypothetical protein